MLFLLLPLSFFPSSPMHHLGLLVLFHDAAHLHTLTRVFILSFPFLIYISGLVFIAFLSCTPLSRSGFMLLFPAHPLVHSHIYIYKHRYILYVYMYTLGQVLYIVSCPPHVGCIYIWFLFSYLFHHFYLSCFG